MKDFHISQANDLIGPHPHLGFWISLLKTSQSVINPVAPKRVLDFGCGDGHLLKIFDLMDDLTSGIGIEIDEKLLKYAEDHNSNGKIQYAHYDKFNDYSNCFDVAYSQEVLYTLPDLTKHANEIYNALVPGGYYFATIGCHIENPLWSYRRDMIKQQETFPVHDYSLEQIANIFYDVGFSVGLKRLPVECFNMYHPQITRDFSKSYTDLVNATSDHKMVFMFWKPMQ